MGIFQNAFTCPKCGSHFFMTVDTSKDPCERRCKGYHDPIYNEYKGCSFTWFSNEDNKYLDLK